MKLTILGTGNATVKDACELGERLNVENLILYHTEDKNILKRQERSAIIRVLSSVIRKTIL